VDQSIVSPNTGGPVIHHLLFRSLITYWRPKNTRKYTKKTLKNYSKKQTISKKENEAKMHKKQT